jgi:hypothetical protein
LIILTRAAIRQTGKTDRRSASRSLPLPGQLTGVVVRL